MSEAGRWIGFLAASVVLSAGAQLLMKAGMIDLAARPAGDTVLNLLQAGAWVAAGLACYAGSLLAWLLVLSRRPLSVAYPLLSLSYVLVYIGAVWWPYIGEQASLKRSCGVLLVMAGVVLVNMRSGRRSE